MATPQERLKRRWHTIAPTQNLLRLAQIRHTLQMPHPALLSLYLQKLNRIPFHPTRNYLRARIWMGFVEMVEPGEGEVEAGHVLVFSSCAGRFLHGEDALAVASKIGLHDGEVEESVLVECPLTGLHSVVKVAVEVVEGASIVSGAPGI